MIKCTGVAYSTLGLYVSTDKLRAWLSGCIAGSYSKTVEVNIVSSTHTCDQLKICERNARPSAVGDRAVTDSQHLAGASSKPSLKRQYYVSPDGWPLQNRRIAMHAVRRARCGLGRNVVREIVS